jgi:hypothetical protein
VPIPVAEVRPASSGVIELLNPVVTLMPKVCSRFDGPLKGRAR